jgi:peroxiredoxin
VKAPELELLDREGRSVRLSQLWAEQPVLLAFLRHFG